ncbi:MAG: 30S ribosomal protein S17 [Candidatus Saccharimonadales bacterium]
MPKIIIGTVTSNKTNKTITVVTHGRRTHPVYKKQYPVSKRFLAHDEKNEASVGDRVSIIETRPISAKKHFKLAEILERPKLQADSLVATKDEQASRRPDSKSKKTKDDQTKEEEQ